MRRKLPKAAGFVVLLLAAWWALGPSPESSRSEAGLGQRVPARSTSQDDLPVYGPPLAPSLDDGVPDVLRSAVRTVSCPLPRSLMGAREAHVGALPWQGVEVVVPVSADAFEVLLPQSDIPAGGTLTTSYVVTAAYDLFGAVVETHVLAEGEPISVPVEVPGFGRTTVLLVQEDGRWSCEVDEPERYLFVRGSVRGYVPGDTTVEGCGQVVNVDGSGRFRMELAAGACALQAHRADGLYRATSPVVEVAGQPGDERVVTLDLPRWRLAGVGVDLAPHPDGAELVGVYDDTPASDAGLEAGDVVVEVCRSEIEGMDPEELQERLVGPEGTEVIYTVVRDDELVEVTMVREQMAAR